MHLLLQPAEIDELCPAHLVQPAAKLRHLHRLGFIRAWRDGDTIKLERAHYEAVSRGEFAASQSPAHNRPRIASLEGAA